MIEVHDAVRIAIDYCGRLFGTVANNLRLEEVELSPDGREWYITVGFDELLPMKFGTPSVALASVFNPPTERKYKIVALDVEAGKVRSVKIREPLERAY